MTEQNEESRIVHIGTKNAQDNLIRHVATFSGDAKRVDTAVEVFEAFDAGSYVIFESSTAEDFPGRKMEAKLNPELFEGVSFLLPSYKKRIPTVLDDSGIHTTSDVAALGRVPFALAMMGRLEPKHIALVMEVTRRATGRPLKDWPKK